MFDHQPIYLIGSRTSHLNACTDVENAHLSYVHIKLYVALIDVRWDIIELDHELIGMPMSNVIILDLSLGYLIITCRSKILGQGKVRRKIRCWENQLTWWFYRPSRFPSWSNLLNRWFFEDCMVWMKVFHTTLTCIGVFVLPYSVDWTSAGWKLRIHIMETFGVCLCKSLVPTHIHFPSLTDLHSPTLQSSWQNLLWAGSNPSLSPFFSFLSCSILFCFGLLTTKV